MLRRPSADITEPIEFLCLLCSHPFNNTDRSPLIICPRSHSCCAQCFQGKLFNQDEEKTQVFCFQCRLPVKKDEARKADFFQDVVKTAVRLRTQEGSHPKAHPEEDTEQARTALAHERNKNEWLIQQYVALERTYQNLNQRHTASEAEYERRVKKQERNIDRLSKLTWEARGDRLFSEGKFKEAIQLSQEILKAAPGLDYEIDGFGSVEDRAGSTDADVVSWYREAARQPCNPYDVLCLGFTQLESYAEAENWYSYRLGKDKNNYRIAIGLANILYNSGKYAQAEKLYLRVVDLKPDFEKSYRQLAFIKIVKENKKEEGRKWAEIAKEKNPQSIYADYLLAISEDTNDAQIESLTRLSETLPKPYARIYNALGFIFKQKKEYEQAISCFKKCIEINPSYEVAHFNLGVIHQERGEVDQAAKCYEESLKKNEKYVNAYLGLGSLYSKKKGEEEKAIGWYQKCVEISPSSVPAHNGLGRAFAILERYDEAVKRFQKCIELNEKHELSYNSLGNVCFYRGELEEAISWYLKCIEINPKYLGPYNGLCNVYSKKGDVNEAKNWSDRRDETAASS